jgi:hypothetical protein
LLVSSEMHFFTFIGELCLKKIFSHAISISFSQMLRTLTYAPVQSTSLLQLYLLPIRTELHPMTKFELFSQNYHQDFILTNFPQVKLGSF